MYLIRLLIIGDTGVGKTSLLVRFNEDTFTLNQKTTIGVDYKAKEMVIPRAPAAAEAGPWTGADEAPSTPGAQPAVDHVKLQIWVSPSPSLPPSHPPQ